MRAVAKGMRPYGTTVAFHAGEAAISWLGLAEPTPVMRFFVGRLSSLWNLLVRLIGGTFSAVERSMFKVAHVALVDSLNDRWQATFRRLAYHSQFIVMDTSAASAGVVYEAEFLRDPDLARRLILIHDGTPTGLASTERQIKSLQPLNPGLTIPVIPYSDWRLHQLTARLGELSHHANRDS
jgi:hypothetical protein